MVSLSLVLPQKVFLAAQSKATEQGIDIGAYCSALLADSLLAENPTREVPLAQVEGHGFDVARNFPGFPPRSIRFAQQVMDEALTHSDVHASRGQDGRAIELKPNFIRIEALLSRGDRAGVRVSFYDNRLMDRNWWRDNPDFRSGIDPEKVLPLLTRGQGNYCRAVVEGESELRLVLPLVHLAYQLKSRFSRTRRPGSA